jgi:hypothetical protein
MCIIFQFRNMAIRQLDLTYYQAMGQMNAKMKALGFFYLFGDDSDVLFFDDHQVLLSDSQTNALKMFDTFEGL